MGLAKNLKDTETCIIKKNFKINKQKPIKNKKIYTGSSSKDPGMATLFKDAVSSQRSELDKQRAQMMQVCTLPKP